MLERTLIIIMLTCAACERETPLPSELHTAPFNNMPDVGLGMRADGLARRHQLWFEPYVGYRETVAGYHVLYYFKGMKASGTQPPKPGDRLLAIEVAEQDTNAMVSDLRYSRYVREATRMLGVSPQCRQQPEGRITFAQYELGNGYYVVRFVRETAGSAQSARPFLVIRAVRRNPAPGWESAAPQRCIR